MKQVLDTAKHMRAINYVKQKIAEGISDKRIVGELVALEKIRKTTAIDIVQQVRITIGNISPKNAQLANLYEWIQDWLDKGISHYQIVDNLVTKGVEYQQAWDMLLDSISFQKEKNEKLNKAQSLADQSAEIYRQIQIWRKQLLSADAILKKLQYRYNLSTQEAQELVRTISLHKKANQKVEIQISDRCTKKNYKRCLLFLLTTLFLAFISYAFFSGIISQILTYSILTIGIGMFIYKLVSRTYHSIEYIQ